MLRKFHQLRAKTKNKQKIRAFYCIYVSLADPSCSDSPLSTLGLVSSTKDPF